MSGMCPPCQQRADAWLDVTVQQLTPHVRIHAIGDDSMQCVRDNARYRVERWARIIREQREGIRLDCLAAHQSVEAAA